MSERRIFEVPDNSDTLISLVNTVPSSWSWVDGFLELPQELAEADNVARGNGFAVQRYHSIKPTIVGLGEDHRLTEPDLYSIIADLKIPSFVTFDEAGFDSEPVDLETVKKIIVSYLRRDYRGWLSFYRDFYNYHKYDNSARCNFLFKPWLGEVKRLFDKRPEYPPAVKIEWDPRYYGKPEHIEPILSVIQSLGLKELVLEPIA